MIYDYAESARLNTILGKRVFKRLHQIPNAEVKTVTGLSIDDLISCWIGDSSYDFQKFLSEWAETGKPMNLKEILGN